MPTVKIAWGENQSDENQVSHKSQDFRPTFQREDYIKNLQIGEVDASIISAVRPHLTGAGDESLVFVPFPAFDDYDTLPAILTVVSASRNWLRESRC